MNPITTQPTTLPAAADPELSVALLIAGLFVILWFVVGVTAFAVLWARGAFAGGLAEAPRRVLTRDRASQLLVVAVGMFVTVIALPFTVVRLTGGGGDAGAAEPRGIGFALAMGGIYLAGLGVAAALHRWLFRGGAVDSLGLREPARGVGPGLLGLLIGLPLAQLVALATGLSLRAGGVVPPEAHPLLPIIRDAGPLAQVGFVLSTVLIVPFFEELLFRGHLQSALTFHLRSRWSAIVLASVVFAALHPWWTIPAIFALSLGLGYVYERTGSLWAAFVMHAGFNGVQTALFFATAAGRG